LHFFTATEENKTQWLGVLGRAFKDISEEHRSIVRNNMAPPSHSARASGMGESFRRQKVGGVSTTLLKKVF
jgi:truncated hemoglobin YjbI